MAGDGVDQGENVLHHSVLFFCLGFNFRFPNAFGSERV